MCAVLQRCLGVDAQNRGCGCGLRLGRAAAWRVRRSAGRLADVAVLGNVDPDEICAHFDGKEKLICRSLFSWVNDGSHFAHDSLYVSIDDSMVESYLSVFKRIFDETGHIAHYNMMMGETTAPEAVETVDSATPLP